MAGMAAVREPWSAARTRGWEGQGRAGRQRAGSGTVGFIRGSLGKPGSCRRRRPLRRFPGAGLDGSRSLASPASHVPLLCPGWVSPSREARPAAVPPHQAPCREHRSCAGPRGGCATSGGRWGPPGSSVTVPGAAERVGPCSSTRAESPGWPRQMAAAWEHVNCIARLQLAAASLPACSRLHRDVAVGRSRGGGTGGGWGASPVLGVVTGCCAHCRGSGWVPGRAARTAPWGWHREPGSVLHLADPSDIPCSPHTFLIPPQGRTPLTNPMRPPRPLCVQGQTPRPSPTPWARNPSPPHGTCGVQLPLPGWETPPLLSESPGPSLWDQCPFTRGDPLPRMPLSPLPVLAPARGPSPVCQGAAVSRAGAGQELFHPPG